MFTITNCFRFDALTELRPFMRTEFLCISVLRVASGPRVKLASFISALTSSPAHPPTPPPPPPRWLVLLFVALWFILRGDLFNVFTLCYFVLVILSPFSNAITSLGEERADLSAFRTFV